MKTTHEEEEDRSTMLKNFRYYKPVDPTVIEEELMKSDETNKTTDQEPYKKSR